MNRVRRRERPGQNGMTGSAAAWATTIGKTARETSFIGIPLGAGISLEGEGQYRSVFSGGVSILCAF